jgi:hypothetical protein
MVSHGATRDLSDKAQEDADALKEWDVPWEPVAEGVGALRCEQSALEDKIIGMRLLSEMKDFARDCGFVCIAVGAFVGIANI